MVEVVNFRWRIGVLRRGSTKWDDASDATIIQLCSITRNSKVTNGMSVMSVRANATIGSGRSRRREDVATLRPTDPERLVSIDKEL